MKKLIHTFLTLAIIAVVFGCSTPEQKNIYVSTGKSDNVRDIILKDPYIAFDYTKLHEVKIQAEVFPENSIYKEISYESDDESIALVDEKGTVTFKKSGIVRIKAASVKDPSIYDYVVVNGYTPLENNVDNIRYIYIENTFAALQKDGGINTYNIHAQVMPSSVKNKDIVHISADPNVAIVDEEGLVKAKNRGNTNIITYSKANPEKYAKTHVIVSDDTEGAEKPEDGMESNTNVKPIDLNADPFSLIAKYYITSYTIGDKVVKVDDKESQLRVNINLALPIVDILMWTRINGVEVSLIRPENVGNYGSIPDIFLALGAEITGKYTLRFVLDSKAYPQFVNQGIIQDGEKIILELRKFEDLEAMSGVGSDVTFKPTGNGGSSIPEKPELGKPIEAERVVLNYKEYTAVKFNEKIELQAKVEPNNANDKTITWKSSDNAVAKVDANGVVTILKNGTAKIEASTKNGKKAYVNILPNTKVDDFALSESTRVLIEGLDTDFQIGYILYPFIMQDDNVNVEYSSSNISVATVSPTGLVKAVSPGESVIYVKIGNITRECYVRVDKKPANITKVSRVVLDRDSGSYAPSDGSFKINASVEPAHATNKRLIYSSSDKSVADVSSAGIVTIRNFGKATITVSAMENPDIKAEYNLVVETLATDVAFLSSEYGVGLDKKEIIKPFLEGNPSNKTVTYSSDNPAIASVDTNTGEVTGNSIGSTKIKAQYVNGKQAEYTLHVYTPLDMSNMSSLEGTYDIVDFNQANGHLDVGTNKYGGVQRMIGEFTIRLEGSTVHMVTKIQMDSNKMNTFGGVAGMGKVEARKGQFQKINFQPETYSPNGFGGTGANNKAKISMDNGLLKMFQQWKEAGIATVNVNTWMKKKSNTVKDLDGNTFIWSKNGKNHDIDANAVQHHKNIKRPAKEPYYMQGVIQ